MTTERVALPCVCETYDPKCIRANRPMMLRDWELCSQKCPPERPCTAEQSELYRNTWDRAVKTNRPINWEFRNLECIHLGDVIDQMGCNCAGKWIRECDIHGKCTLRNQGNGLHSCLDECPDYKLPNSE